MKRVSVIFCLAGIILTGIAFAGKNRPKLAPIPLSAHKRLPVTAVQAGASSSLSEGEFDANEITEGIYLGGLSAALSDEFLLQNQISVVIGVGEQCASGESNDRVQRHLLFRCPDCSDAPIETCFEDAFKLIDDALVQEKNVLIHCSRGISRSASVLIAYYMNKGYSLSDAWRLVEEKRKIIEPNLGFMLKLQAYEQKLTDQKITK